MTARSSTLTLFARHCPHAVTLREDSNVRRLDEPVIGIAAHDVLHALGERRNVDTVCERLIAVGREGVDSSGPMDPDRVLEGRRIAETWARDRDFPRDSLYEAGFGFDRSWNPTSYTDPDAWLNTRIDRIDVVTEVDEDVGETVILRVVDYKSSWQAGAADLETIQRKIQVVAVWKAMGLLKLEEVHAIEAVVCNLRTGHDATRRLWLPDDVPILERWQREIEITVAAFNRRPRIPSPGPGCIGCPRAHACEHRADTTRMASDMGEATANPLERWARSYTGARALMKQLEDDLKRGVNASDTGEVVLPDGSAVGFMRRSSRSPTPDSGMDAWRRWARDMEPSEDLLRSFLQAMGGLQMTQLRKLAKVLGGSREETTALMDEWTEERMRAVWSYDPPGTRGGQDGE